MILFRELYNDYEIEVLETGSIIHSSSDQLQKLNEDPRIRVKPGIIGEFQDKIKLFDNNGKKLEVVKLMLKRVKDFQDKYPFKSNPEKIEDLTKRDLFILEKNEHGDFFHQIVYELDEVGHLNLWAPVYREASKHIDRFKELLYIVVDDNKSLEEKINTQ
ncbi:MAG: hypothetical protein ACOC1X_02505 [Promethearchaeota archaeon]